MVDDRDIIKDHRKIIKLISSGAQIDVILPVIINSLESHPLFSKIIHTTITKYDRAQDGLIKLAHSREYKSFLTYMKIGPSECSTGAAAYYKETVITPNIYRDPRWAKYRNFAKKFGIKASWSTPILSSTNDLLGTLTVYYNEEYYPDKEMVDVFKWYNHLTAIALEIRIRVEAAINKCYLTIGNNKLSYPTIHDQLKTALKNDEFMVYYQPYFNLDKSDIGLEALIRWNHPDLGLLTPASFLESAEKTGFIIEMEEWILQQAIKDAAKLKQNGLSDLYLSINVSAEQFDNDNFSNVLMSTLEHYALNPNHLTLEITERFLVKQNNIKFMNNMKRHGVHLAIDDFGTAYSSLQYLKSLPVDELKIDQSFIHDLHTNENSRKIVEMIIMLSHQLNLTVVAEGVESKQQLELLKQMDCNRVQGYLFSKPKPIGEVLPKLAKSNVLI